MEAQAQKPLMAARVLHPPGRWNIWYRLETFYMEFSPAFLINRDQGKLISVIAASRQQ